MNRSEHSGLAHFEIILSDGGGCLKSNVTSHAMPIHGNVRNHADFSSQTSKIRNSPKLVYKAIGVVQHALAECGILKPIAGILLPTPASKNHSYAQEKIVPRFAVFAISFLLLTTAGFAQVPNGNVFVGYSYMSTDLVPNNRANLNGWNASVEGKVLPLLGIVADFSGHYGTQNFSQLPECSGCASCSNSVHEENYLFGPRLSVSVGKFRPFVHALVGVGHISESAGISPSVSGTSFSDALGGGIDYHLIPLISWRVQADALQTRFFGSTQQNVRISTGIAFHF